MKKIFWFLILTLIFSQNSLASTGEERVLEVGKKIVQKKEVIKGSCWTFVDEVYKRAGYPQSKRLTVYKGKKTDKKFADINLIQKGDWLYYINHSFNDVEHSGIFIEWVDKKNKIGKILSYTGMNKNIPGKYKDFKLNSVYNIMRPNTGQKQKSQEGSFKKGSCQKDLILHQNLRALKKGYVRNGKYDRYTRGIVKEAKILQRHLNRLGFNAGPIDGIIGPKTHGAILRLQRFLETKADSYVGPKTRALLNNSCGKNLTKDTESKKEEKKNEEKKETKINLLEIHSVLEKGISDKVAQGDILKLQKYLKSKGYEIKYLDGIFGNEVETALKKFTKKELGREENYFDPRWFIQPSKKNLNLWEPYLVKEYLGYGKFDWFYLDFPFKERDIKEISCGGIKKDYIFKNEKIILPISKQGTGKYICKLKMDFFGKEKEFEITEVYFRYVKRPTTKVNLIKKYAEKPDPELQKRIAEENKILKDAYKKANKKIKFNSSFANPLDTKIISPFGKTRIFNDGRKSIHSGTDFKAQKRLPIKAANDGVVIMAGKDLYFCGKGVIMNHGMNLFSIYCHLSENNVKIGDKVKKGQIIGKTGATGRVSGPHLHLGMKYNGGYVDFQELKKKSEILK